MKETFKNIGIALTKDEAKKITGGNPPDSCLVNGTRDCSADVDCCSGKCEYSATDTSTYCVSV